MKSEVLGKAKKVFSVAQWLCDKFTNLLGSKTQRSIHLTDIDAENGQTAAIDGIML
jgi:hypothetical protein